MKFFKSFLLLVLLISLAPFAQAAKYEYSMATTGSGTGDGAAEVEGWSFHSIGVSSGYANFNAGGDYIQTKALFPSDITNVTIRAKPSSSTVSKILELVPMADGIADSSAKQLLQVVVAETDQSFDLEPGYNGVRISLGSGSSGSWYVCSVTIYTKDPPQLSSPTSFAPTSIDQSSFIVSWDPVDNATNYVFQYWASGAIATNEMNVGTVASATPTGLTINTTYGCRVKAQGADALDSDWTADLSVKTLTGYALPVWSVGEVPAFTEGTEGSFTVSATLSDIPADVSFEGLVPAASGTAPSFVAGTFAWTPSTGSAGDYVARFTVTDDARVHTNDVALSVKSPVHVETLFEETFSECANKWSSTAYLNETDKGEALLDPAPDQDGWTGLYIAKGPSAIRLGTADKFGYAITPEITLENFLSTGTIQLSFAAATVSNATKKGQIQVDVLDAAGEIASSYSTESLPFTESTGEALISGESYRIGPLDMEVPSPFRIRFAASGGYGRVCLDSVLVEQTLRADLTTLDAPTGLAAEANGFHALSVSWDAVANASGYVLEVSEDGFVATNVTVSGTSVVVTDLADDTEYSLRVRSEGDDVQFQGSEWSSSISVETPHDPDRPDFYLDPCVVPAFYAQVGGSFGVVATNVDGSPVAVRFVSLRPTPLTPYGFSDAAVFSWVPSVEDQGDYVATFSAQTAGGVYLFRVPITAEDRPALLTPFVEEKSHDCNTIELDWDNQTEADLLRLAKWGLCVWTGSPAKTDTHYREVFADSRVPGGWVMENGSVEAANNVQVTLEKDKTGFAMTPTFPAAVTNLEFYTKCSTKAGKIDVLTLSGFSTVSNDWVSLAVYTNETASATKRQVRLSEVDGFVRFRWDHDPNPYKSYIGTVEADYAGCGAKFLLGTKDSFQDLDRDTLSYTLRYLKPSTEYYVQLRAVGDGTDEFRDSAVLRCLTGAAPKGLIIFMR